MTTEEQLREAGYTEEQLREAGFGPLQTETHPQGACPWGDVSGSECWENSERGLCNQECLR